ncbi:MAG: hypothetical protein ACI9R3_000621 [Verrucomicrobiales bacterium]|jgi:hypothetical protein
MMKTSKKSRWFKRMLCAAIVLVTLIALFYVIENYRGAKAWEQTRADLEADGITLDLGDLLHPTVPDEENFCAIPLLRELPLVIDHDTEKGEPGAIRRRLSSITIFKHSEGGPKIPIRKRAYLAGKPTDLEPWRSYIEQTGSLPVPNTGDAAADILEGMKTFAPEFEELAAALDRPYAVLIPRLEERLQGVEPLNSLSVPSYSAIQAITYTLSLRASAAAQTGNAATAIESFRIIARFAEAVGNEKTLMSLLVQSTLIATMERGIWELLWSRSASAAELQTLEHALRKIDLQSANLTAMQMELIMVTDYLELAKTTSPVKLAHLPPDLEPSEPIGTALSPNGWWDQNKVTIVDAYRERVIEPLTEQNFGKAKALEQVNDLASGPYNFMVTRANAAWGLPVRFFLLENKLRQMRTACALERYYIAHGAYPDSLEMLVPDFIDAVPLDPIDQQPMRYRTSPEFRYLLYSIGYDQVDDGGKAHPKGWTLPSNLRNRDVTGFDWVWLPSPD